MHTFKINSGVTSWTAPQYKPPCAPIRRFILSPSLNSKERNYDISLYFDNS